MRPWALGSAGLATFVLCTAMLLPSTALKSSWTNVNYVRPIAAASPPPSTPVETFAYPPVNYGTPVSLDSAGPATVATEESETARIAGDDQAYGDGYAWAADRAVEDRRACDRFHGSRAEGCLDYVASLTPVEVEEPEQPST